MEPFIVKHYSSDERQTIKGNGFDGLEIGDCREGAEEFIRFVNMHMNTLDDFDDDELINELEMRGYNCSEPNPIIVDLQDLYELKHTGKTAEFDTAFASYCWQEIGRIL